MSHLSLALNGALRASLATEMRKVGLTSLATKLVERVTRVPLNADSSQILENKTEKVTVAITSSHNA